MTDYTDWVGNKELREDVISLAPCVNMGATMDDHDTTFNTGDRVPRLWHWLYFLPYAHLSNIGPDGHPKRGGFLPPVELPRRMFAGARMTFHDDLMIGEAATREGEIMAVKEKSGKTGTLVFVTVKYTIKQGDRLCVEEEQDIVYREPGGKVPAPEVVDILPDVPAGSWTRTITPTPPLLFRFSALTFNSHRIHYDRPYTMDEENYPGLVVQGPLTATLLMDLVRKNAGKKPATFTFRGLAPLFDLAPFRIVGTPSDDGVELEAQGPNGKAAMSASVTF